MESASIQFIAFGLVAALLSRISAASGWRQAVLLAANAALLVLLGATVETAAPMVGFLLLGYLAVLLVRRGVASAQAACIVLLVLVYIWLKRYTVFPAGMLLALPYLTVGLSYIFFRVLHLVIEAGHEGPARRVPVAGYLAYTLNFTTLVSGPIQRYDDFEGQQAAPPAPLNAGVIGAQVERLVIGFFKVNVLALLLDMVHVDALADLARPIPAADRTLALLRLAIAYPFFLYCNFSGYIDIVIAIARLMGLRLPENFDRPFAARSVIEFWTRWHITLSTWLKTYVYNPLFATLLRNNPIAALEPFYGVLCFFVTFFLVGLWHGRTSEFAMFGLLTGGGMALNKAWQIVLARRMGKKAYKALAVRPLYGDLSRGLNFAWFAFTLTWFWADWANIGVVLGTVSPGLELLGWTGVWLLAALGLGVWERLRTSLAGQPGIAAAIASPVAQTMYVTALASIAFLMVAVLSQPAPGIVYRTF